MKLICALFILLIYSVVGYSQNKIYLSNEVRDGKVVEINSGEIKYTNPASPAVVNSVSRDKTFLLFNDKGRFLVISLPGFPGLFLSKDEIDNFVNYNNNAVATDDKIFTKHKHLISCNIINEDILSFFINLNGIQSKVDKDTVDVVIYKNGEHKLTSDIETAADVLYSFQPQSKAGSQRETSVTNVPVTGIKEVTRSGDSLKKEADTFALKKESEITAQQQPLIDTQQVVINSSESAEETNRKYLLILVRANALYNEGDYSRAKYFYSKANEMKPNEKEPLDGIAKINERLFVLDKPNRDSIQYEEYITAANSLANNKEFDSALVIYNKAKALKPNDYYVNQEIKYVQSEISRLKDEAKKAAEAKFNDAMARAEIAVREKRYKDALADYNEALSVHPDNKYAMDRARILAYQISLQKKTADR